MGSMRILPTLRTERLLLRPFRPSDAADVQRLAGDRAIADTTASIPHPYPDGAAEEWIAGHAKGFEHGQELVLAVALRESDVLIGAVSLLQLSALHERGEIGYWIGKPYWNEGYGTEAARALIGYGFGVLGLQRIVGRFLKRNPASGRVMTKAGMREEGCLRAHEKKWDRLEDVMVFGILRSEWPGGRSGA